MQREILFLNRCDAIQNHASSLVLYVKLWYFLPELLNTFDHFSEIRTGLSQLVRFARSARHPKLEQLHSSIS